MMKIDDGVLYLDEEIQDEGIDELIAILSQDEIEKLEITTDSIDPASMQVLLCSSKTKEVHATDEHIANLFENLDRSA